MPGPGGRSSSAGLRGGPGLVLVLLGAAFLVSAAAFIAPAVARPWQRAAAPETPADVSRPSPAVPSGLSAAERARVLAYAGTMQPDDSLVEVRPGVLAKRSNVEGVRLDGRTVYYDVLGHQTFGPLGRGRVREQDVVILARDGSPPFEVLVYSLK
jgi:hypothetical protein